MALSRQQTHFIQKSVAGGTKINFNSQVLKATKLSSAENCRVCWKALSCQLSSCYIGAFVTWFEYLTNDQSSFIWNISTLKYFFSTTAQFDNLILGQMNCMPAHTLHFWLISWFCFFSRSIVFPFYLDPSQACAGFRRNSNLKEACIWIVFIPHIPAVTLNPSSGEELYMVISTGLLLHAVI